MTSDTAPAGRQRRGWLWLLAVLVIGVLSGATGWAVATVMRPAEDPLEASTFTFATVEPGEVGSSINLNSIAEWAPTAVGSNQASGIITSVKVAPGDEVVQGSTLYLVNQRPVVVAQGSVPAFRALGNGAEGEDVAQLQGMLQALGYFSGSVDGKAGYRTVSSIRAWQKAMGVAETGTVELGDVIFVPTLPTRITLDGEVIARGKPVAGGEPVLLGLPQSPLFTLPVTEAQSAMIPTGTPVQITSPEGNVWEALAGDRASDAQSQAVVVTLSGAEEQVVCADECSEVPVTGEALLPSRVVTVPTVQGLVVPSSALFTDASGRIAVIDPKGTLIPVTVVASARGMSVIEGVDEGVKVRIPAEDSSG